MQDVIIIGAGVIGTLIARNLSAYQTDVLVLEKNLDVGDGASGANSAIVHSGYDPIPGTKKAEYNVSGNAMFDQLSRELGVPFRRIGSLTLAFDEEGEQKLSELLNRAKQNGVPAEILFGYDAIKEKEPHVSKEVKAALYCPTAGIVDPFLLTARAMENALDNGAKLHLGEAVTAIKPIDGGYEVQTPKATYQTRYVINAAGAYADEIAKMIGLDKWKIIPKKGQYFVLDHFGPFVKTVLFPLPSQKGKGMLVTPTTAGNYLVGPSSSIEESKDDVGTDSLTLSQIKEGGARLVDHLPLNEAIRVYAGLRSSIDGGDFVLEESKPGFLNLIGIDSPGLASSPYIGKLAAEKAAKELKLTKKEHFDPIVKRVKLSTLSLEERARLIEENPDYGEIICTCEKISLGEIRQELHSSLPCLTIKAMKKRTRCGFGKCQGGFCQARIVEEIAKAYGKRLDEIDYGFPDSKQLKERSK